MTFVTHVSWWPFWLWPNYFDSTLSDSGFWTISAEMRLGHDLCVLDTVYVIHKQPLCLECSCCESGMIFTSLVLFKHDFYRLRMTCLTSDLTFITWRQPVVLGQMVYDSNKMYNRGDLTFVSQAWLLWVCHDHHVFCDSEVTQIIPVGLVTWPLWTIFTQKYSLCLQDDIYDFFRIDFYYLMWLRLISVTLSFPPLSYKSVHPQ